MDNQVKELIEKVENLGWSVEEEDKTQYRFSKHSPQGQDFVIAVEGDCVKDLIDKVHDAYENFDVSEETYLWLDNTGHGTNGAPYHMKDVLEDMEACEQMILDLYNELIKK